VLVGWVFDTTIVRRSHSGMVIIAIRQLRSRHDVSPRNGMTACSARGMVAWSALLAAGRHRTTFLWFFSSLQIRGFLLLGLGVVGAIIVRRLRLRSRLRLRCRLRLRRRRRCWWHWWYWRRRQHS